MRSLAFAMAVTASLAFHLSAQDPKSPPPIDTDRPDLTDGTGVVARGRLQLESGLTAQTSRDGTTAWSAPELLVRIGVMSRVELRISQTYRSLETDPGIRVNGFDDVQLGSKVHLVDQHALPAISVEAFTTIATGANGIGAGRALPGGALLLQQNSDGPWSAGIEIEVARSPASGASGFASLSIQYQVTERVQLYGEYYQLRPDLSAGMRQHYLNSGVLILLTNDIQVDARVGAGLNQDADRSFVGLGFAFRR